jgi:hypothetical protein
MTTITEILERMDLGDLVIKIFEELNKNLTQERYTFLKQKLDFIHGIVKSRQEAQEFSSIPDCQKNKIFDNNVFDEESEIGIFKDFF